jgi:hypothetical protein
MIRGARYIRCSPFFARSNARILDAAVEMRIESDEAEEEAAGRESGQIRVWNVERSPQREAEENENPCCHC